MGILDSLRGFGRGVVGLELGRGVAAVQLKGDGSSIVAAGQSAHAGLEGAELGSWLSRWLDTIDNSAKTAHAVIVDDEVYHYLVTMPEMSASERHLAAGAEIRKLSPVPAAQLSYAHMGVGAVQDGGATKERVLISAVGRGAVERTRAAAAAAGLDAEVITTVPAALIRASELLPPLGGGSAIAYLAGGRSYLVVFQDGVVELVRDFALRSDDRDFDPQTMTDLILSELRRSFLYFGQRAQGATVSRLTLTGPMANLADVAARLREGLSISVELFDGSGEIDLGPTDSFDQPALAVALGAARMNVKDGGSLVAPEDIEEARFERASSTGLWVGAAVLILLFGLGLVSFLNGTVEQRRLTSLQERVAARQPEMQQAQARAQERVNHVIRTNLLEQRALESTLFGATLQRIGQRVPDQLALERLTWRPVAGPQGSSYWDLEIQGLVFGSTRSESQAVFNRFYALLASDPIVDSVHLTESLAVGTASARQAPQFESADGQFAARNRRADTSNRFSSPDPAIEAARGTRRWPYVSRNPWLARSRLWYLDDAPVDPRATAGFDTGGGGGAAPEFRTTLDDLPPFGPSATSVGFTILVELKSIAPGGTR